MTNSKDKCCVMGSLVDARNVGTHKSVKLTVHVPAELAMKVFESFGWPTMAEPVAVAIARLNTETTAEIASEDSTTPARARTPWDLLTASQQAGILCADRMFWTFLSTENYGPAWNEEEAIKIVRERCHVKSRTQILPDTAAESLWRNIVSDYRTWQLAAQVVP